MTLMCNYLDLRKSSQVKGGLLNWSLGYFPHAPIDCRTSIRASSRREQPFVMVHELGYLNLKLSIG